MRGARQFGWLGRIVTKAGGIGSRGEVSVDPCACFQVELVNMTVDNVSTPKVRAARIRELR
jgi:hypothetical protein